MIRMMTNSPLRLTTYLVSLILVLYTFQLSQHSNEQRKTKSTSRHHKFEPHTGHSRACLVHQYLSQQYATSSHKPSGLASQFPRARSIIWIVRRGGPSRQEDTKPKCTDPATGSRGEEEAVGTESILGHPEISTHANIATTIVTGLTQHRLHRRIRRADRSAMEKTRQRDVFRLML